MTIFGFDMSHFDAPGIGDAVAEGISFLTHKAGGDADDPEIAAWWSGVKNLRPSVLLGAYWVLYPGNASARADAFIARLDATCAGWRDHAFLLQVDCEEWNNSASTVPSKSDITTFCNRLVAKLPNLRPVVYAPEWVYGGKLAGLGYPLWASTYVSGSGNFKSIYPGDGSSRWDAYSGQTPAILQYADTAEIGGQSPCDASAYRGTLAQLIALVAPGWEDDVALTSDDIKAIWGYGLANPYSGQTQAAGDIRRYAPSAQRTMDLQAAVAQLTSTVTAFITAETADDATKSKAIQAIQDAIAAVAPSVTAQVIAALPQGSDPVSQDEVTAAVEKAFHDAFSAA